MEETKLNYPQSVVALIVLDNLRKPEQYIHLNSQQPCFIQEL